MTKRKPTEEPVAEQAVEPEAPPIIPRERLAEPLIAALNEAAEKGRAQCSDGRWVTRLETPEAVMAVSSDRKVQFLYANSGNHRDDQRWLPVAELAEKCFYNGWVALSSQRWLVPADERLRQTAEHLHGRGAPCSVTS